MGSCFALEIRIKLRSLGYDVYPKYLDLPFDSRTQSPGRLPERDNINHYDTFVMRQEIERAIEGRRWSVSDFWTLMRPRIANRKGWERACQDPYRRQIFAADMERLADASDKIGRCIDEGLAAADVIILTLGLTECWRNHANGLFVCTGPIDKYDEIMPLVEFHPSTFAENYANLNAMLDRIRAAFPLKRIVLTVSPVPLARTWTGEDVVVANLNSKSTLRAVAGQVCRERPNVVYWPSFEYGMKGDVFKEDGRHVQIDVVDRIVTAFLETHRADLGAVPRHRSSA